MSCVSRPGWRVAGVRFAALVLFCSLLLVAAHLPAVGAAPTAERWVGTWATSPRAEDAATVGLALNDGSLRQVFHVSIGGGRVRLRLSNAFGATPLVFHGVHLALATPGGGIQPDSDRALSFHGKPGAAIPPGALLVSDPVELPLAPRADVAVTIHFQATPLVLTTHPGSRTNSYLLPGDHLADAAFAGATKMVRWFFINGLDVVDPDGRAAALAVLGDSITDGYGCTTDANNRWTDALALRLGQNPATARVAVLNHGIGGNRLLRDGLGPNALARLDRDVLAQTGVRWLLVLEGINDLGTRREAREKGEAFASAAEIIGAYDQIITRAHTHGIKVLGGTLLPFEGSKNYWSADADADRATINAWIRGSGRFDAVVDFDAGLRDPQAPGRLAAAFDNDHLHPSLAGYVEMARLVNLGLFAPADSTATQPRR